MAGPAPPYSKAPALISRGLNPSRPIAGRRRRRRDQTILLHSHLPLTTPSLHISGTPIPLKSLGWSHQPILITPPLPRLRVDNRVQMTGIAALRPVERIDPIDHRQHNPPLRVNNHDRKARRSENPEQHPHARHQPAPLHSVDSRLRYPSRLGHLPLTHIRDPARPPNQTTKRKARLIRAGVLLHHPFTIAAQSATQHRLWTPPTCIARSVDNPPTETKVGYSPQFQPSTTHPHPTTPRQTLL